MWRVPSAALLGALSLAALAAPDRAAAALPAGNLLANPGFEEGFAWPPARSASQRRRPSHPPPPGAPRGP
jgi:hypothetical protein